MKFPVLKKNINLTKDLKYEHQSGWVVGCLGGGWLEGSLGGWLEGSWSGWVCGVVGGGGVHGGVGGGRIHGVGAHTHPSMNSYNVKTFHFMNTNPPIKHIQSVTLLLYIYSPTHEHL